jgi:DNA-binding SARP family transcriptional activator
MNKRYILIYISHLFVIIFFLYATQLNAQTYGLKFQGQDFVLDERTELDLTPDDLLKFQEEFEISFDCKIDTINPNSIFGYIFRIVNQENYNVDLLSAPSPVRRLNLVIGKNNSIIPISYPFDSFENWVNIRVKFILSDDKLVFYLPDTFYVANDIGFNRMDEFKIIFGANDFNQFKTTDVPAINIKNLKLSEKGVVKYHWLLDETEGEIATDKLQQRQAKVKNPVWLKLKHQSWQKNYDAEVDDHLIVAFDEKNERIFMVGTDELHIYLSKDDKTEKIKYQNKPLFLTTGYNSIYNPTDNKIYCYLFDDEPIYSLNIETGTWSDTGAVNEFETKHRHHNRFYNPNNNSIYLFGGYGFHRYNNAIRKIDLTNGNFENLRTDDSILLPRYLAGLGNLNDTVYILGGYGSETGNQMINPQSYYDLIGYSIKDSSLFKKFEIPRIIDDMTVANSMWIDKNTREYYALVFEKSKFDGYLQLIKGNLDSPEIEKLGNEIFFQFLDVRSYASLFFMAEQQKLYAYTSYLSETGKTKATIYSINYPPDKFEAEIISSNKNNGIYWFFGVASILLFGFTLWFYQKRKKKANVALPFEQQQKQENNPIAYSLEPESEEIHYQLIFFGGFQVFNRDFVDITNKFSPLLKELFLLIMLNTFKKNKGIASDKISEILWYDKSEKSARNNKAVNIAKLRNILAEIGGCELTKKTGYWKIISESKQNKSDYINFLNITASTRNLTKQKINQLIKITEKGAFLHNVQYQWLDEFKALVSEKIIDTLIEYANACDIKVDADFIIHLANCVFNFDLINEDAMILKCKAEYCMGKHSLAKATYERFFKEYRTMYGQEYEKSFLSVLEINE